MEPPGNPQVTKLAISLPVKSLQSHPTLCSPKDCNLPGFSVHEILQAGILECVAMSASRVSPQHRDRTHISCLAGGFFSTSATWETTWEGRRLNIG